MTKHILSTRAVESDDAAAIANIYNYYVENSHISFETTAVSATEMANRIGAIVELGLPWFVAESAHEILGYAYASQWKSRRAYAGTLEVTVYVAHSHSGRGIGAALYNELFASLQSSDCHTAIGTIALPNDASVGLHEAFGMQRVGEFKEAGYKKGKWIDVGFWQRVF